MQKLTTGISQTQFLALLNANFVELATLRSVGAYLTILSTDDYVSLINSNYGSTEVWAGMKGRVFENAINNSFITKTGALTLTQIADYVKIDIVDLSGGLAQHELYESKNGGAYTLVTTLAVGVLTYNNYTWQNATMSFKVKDLISNAFSPVSNITMPLVFWTDQTTPETLTFPYSFVLSAGKTVNINWGDGSSNNYTTTQIPTHIYTVSGIYPIKLSGDVNYITQLDFDNLNIFASVSKWVLPSSMVGFSALGNSSGLPTTPPMLTGDLNTNLITSSCSAIQIRNTGITSFPRGDYSGITFFDCRNNPCPKSELDSWLAYLNIFYGTHTPTVNMAFLLEGLWAGPIRYDNADRLGIIAKFVAAGKTCTITANLHTVMYGDAQSKVYVPLLPNPCPGYPLDMVHPGVIDCGSAWNGYRYWMVNTPNPFVAGVEILEIITIWASNDGLNWEIPAGASPYPFPYKQDGTYTINPAQMSSHSDTDLYFENGVLYCYFDLVLPGNLKFATVMISSMDGKTWGTFADLSILHEYDGAENKTLTGSASPSIVKSSGVYYMYYHHAVDKLMYRRHCATINGSYIEEEALNLDHTVIANCTGWWHNEVRIFNNKFWFVGNALGTRGVGSAVSDNGIDFTVDPYLLEYSPDPYSPILPFGLDWSPYRPCFMFVGSQAVLYYSASDNLNPGVEMQYLTYRMNINLIE
jgi:PKD repeat protein